MNQSNPRTSPTLLKFVKLRGTSQNFADSSKLRKVTPESYRNRYVSGRTLSVFKGNWYKIANTIIDIIHSTASGDSRQGRPLGGEATEWHLREPQAPEGKETAALKLCTAAELKCWSLSTHCATTGLHLSRKTMTGGDLYRGLLY